MAFKGDELSFLEKFPCINELIQQQILEKWELRGCFPYFWPLSPLRMGAKPVCGLQILLLLKLAAVHVISAP